MCTAFLAHKPDIYRCIRSIRDILGFYVEFKIVFGTVWTLTQLYSALSLIQRCLGRCTVLSLEDSDQVRAVSDSAELMEKAKSVGQLKNGIGYYFDQKISRSFNMET